MQNDLVETGKLVNIHVGKIETNVIDAITFDIIFPCLISKDNDVLPRVVALTRF